VTRASVRDITALTRARVRTRRPTVRLDAAERLELLDFLSDRLHGHDAELLANSLNRLVGNHA
jgi:hypothetical protein